ncbi:hypothetical protein BLNAU_18765 [Blattamonas nauphoetae]|uniref:Uncharacterized protein n=1 Tax=Blattamonas nauphoetae TaxID=2049346 RepID=A0ABQ9X7F4_9EUKA|nr:hypothetical protein BLNAU_18765 [Blattamonas nauphoetae]
MPDIDKQYQEKITEYQELILEPKRLQSSLRNYDLNSYTSRDSDMKRSVVPLAACATALSRMAPDDILDDVHDIFHKSLIKFYRYAKKSKYTFSRLFYMQIMFGEFLGRYFLLFILCCGIFVQINTDPYDD